MQKSHNYSEEELHKLADDESYIYHSDIQREEAAPVQVSIVKASALTGERIMMNVAKSGTFSTAMTKKFQTACDYAEIVVNSLEFKDGIEARKSFTSGGELTGKDVYARIRKADEHFPKKTSPDREIDLIVDLYQANLSRTVGYTSPSDPKIHGNLKYWNSYTPAEIAGNLIHEWTHKLGFGHTSNYTKDRELSIPYFVGYLVEELAEKLAKGQKLIDLYPATTTVPVPDPVTHEPVPTPVPIPTQVPTKTVCSWNWSWQFPFLHKVCWKE